MINLPKILMLSGTVPNQSGPGALMLRDLWSHYPHDLIFGMFPLNQADVENQIDTNLSDRLVRGVPVAFQRVQTSIFGKLGRVIRQMLVDFKLLKSVTRFYRNAVGLGREKEIDCVWVLLNNPACCLVASFVAKKLKKPLFTYVMDDHRYLAHYFNLDPFLTKLMANCTKNAISMAEHCAVAGNSMGEIYEKEFNVTCINLWHGVDKSLWLPAETTISADSMLTIGFAGSVTARSAFDCLMEALDRINWKIGERQVALKLLGHFFRLASKKEACIEYLGWRSMEATIAALHDCDILYLPQPFEKENLYITTLSFPVKTITYLAAGRPILLHAPPYASLVKYDKSGVIFEHCSNLNPQDLLKALNFLAKIPDLYRERALEGRIALKKHFSKSVVRTLFAKFLKIDENQLLPGKI